jgi:hypothetical protein
MIVYVANCTKQYAMLNYRVPEFKSQFTQPCDAGQQIMLVRPDLNMIQVQSIIDQLQQIGGWLVDELDAMPREKMVWWLMSVDKPISEDKIRRALEHNRRVQFLEGQEFRKRAAIATHQNLARTTPHAADTMEVTIQEEITGGSTGIGGDPAVADGYRIDRTGP